MKSCWTSLKVMALKVSSQKYVGISSSSLRSRSSVSIANSWTTRIPSLIWGVNLSCMAIVFSWSMNAVASGFKCQKAVLKKTKHVWGWSYQMPQWRAGYAFKSCLATNTGKMVIVLYSGTRSSCLMRKTMQMCTYQEIQTFNRPIRQKNHSHTKKSRKMLSSHPTEQNLPQGEETQRITSHGLRPMWAKVLSNGLCTLTASTIHRLKMLASCMVAILFVSSMLRVEAS